MSGRSPTRAARYGFKVLPRTSTGTVYRSRTGGTSRRSVRESAGRRRGDSLEGLARSAVGRTGRRPVQGQQGQAGPGQQRRPAHRTSSGRAGQSPPRWRAARKQRHTVTRIFHRLVEERGADVSSGMVPLLRRRPEAGDPGCVRQNTLGAFRSADPSGRSGGGSRLRRRAVRPLLPTLPPRMPWC